MIAARRPRPSRRLPAAVLALAGLGICAPALAAPAPPAAVGVNLAGRTALAQVKSATVLIDRGTLAGSPVGSGRVTLVYTLHPGSGIASTSFIITNARGTVTGAATSTYSVDRLHITFTGKGSLTSGTRAYSGLRSGPLEFNALHSITGRKEAITLTGRTVRP